MKSILLIGLGRFGQYMAMKLAELRNEVMVVDNNEERVNALMPYVASGQIGDSTNEQFISSLGVRNFDLCVVAIGNNFQSSLETTALLKECGAKFVLARASREVHSKFLLRNGADRVVYTEKEMAVRLAVKYGSNNVFDYIELTPDYSIYEIEVPHNWVGKTILQVNVRSKYHVSVLGTKLNGKIMPNPKPEHQFQREETLMIMGHNDDVQRLIH